MEMIRYSIKQWLHRFGDKGKGFLLYDDVTRNNLFIPADPRPPPPLHNSGEGVSGGGCGPPPPALPPPPPPFPWSDMALLERLSSGLVAPAAAVEAAAAAAAEALAALAATAAATAPACVPGGSRYPERVIQSITWLEF